MAIVAEGSIAAANDRMIREFLSAWEQRDTDHIVGLFAEDGVYHSIPLTPIAGRAAIREFVAGFEGKPAGAPHERSVGEIIARRPIAG